MKTETSEEITKALDWSNSRQGKCEPCKAYHVWPSRMTKLADAKCPACGAALKRTTWNCKFARQEWPRGLGVA